MLKSLPIPVLFVWNMMAHTPFFFSQKSNSSGSIALRIKLVDFFKNWNPILNKFKIKSLSCNIRGTNVRKPQILALFQLCDEPKDILLFFNFSSYGFNNTVEFSSMLSECVKRIGSFEWRWLSRLVSETAVVWFGMLWCVPSKMYLIPPKSDRIRPLPIADAMCDTRFLNGPNPTERPAHTYRLQ